MKKARSQEERAKVQRFFRNRLFFEGYRFYILHRKGGAEKGPDMLKYMEVARLVPKSLLEPVS